MEPFISRWKTDAPITDIANLSYPHTVMSLNSEQVAVIESVEDAEKLLDWYKTNYDHNKITQSLVRGSSARQKIRAAAERREYLGQKAARQANATAAWEVSERVQADKKEQLRSARLTARHVEAATAWAPVKLRERDQAIERVLATAKALKRLPKDMTAEGYAELSTLASSLGASVGVLRTHCHGVTSSKMLQTYVDMCAANNADQEAG